MLAILLEMVVHIATLVNSLGITSIILVANYHGAEAVTRFPHGFSSRLLFPSSLSMFALARQASRMLT